MLIKLKKNQTFIGLTLLILLGTIWGTGYSIARFAMTNGVSPFGYSFWQSLGPAIIVSLVVCINRTACSEKGYSSLLKSEWRREKPPFLKGVDACSLRRGGIFLAVLSRRTSFYLICGLTGIVIPNTAIYFSAVHLPASILAMVVNIVPVIAYPLALFSKLEVFNWQRMLGVGLAFCGLMFIILPNSSLPSPTMIPWVLFSLIAPLSFAVCSIYIANYQPTHSDSLTLSAGMLIASSLLLIPIVLVTHSFYAFHLPLLLSDWVIMLEIILSSLGYVLFFKLIKVAGPVYYSLVDTIVVLTGLFWGRIIFGEHLNRWTGLAIFFILLALILVTHQQWAASLPLKTKRKNERTQNAF